MDGERDRQIDSKTEGGQSHQVSFRKLLLSLLLRLERLVEVLRRKVGSGSVRAVM